MKTTSAIRALLLAAASLLPAAPSPVNAQSVTNGLVVYLDFDNNINAQAGTAVGGLLYTGTAKYDAGVFGQAATFVNDQGAGQPSDWAITLGSLENVYSNDFSIAVWVKTLSGDGAWVGNKDWTSGGDIGFCLNSYYDDFLNYFAAGGSRNDIGARIRDGSWHHVATVFDRTNNVVTVFVDGANAASSSIGPIGVESFNAGFPTLVGASGPGVYAGNADLDDLAVWGRALTSGEIGTIYANGIAGTNLVGNAPAWPLYIAQPPVGVTSYAGEAARLSVLGGGGAGAYSYQWRESGTNIAGATNRTLVYFPVAATNAGDYSAVISDSVGSVTSAPAALIVLPVPNITTGLAVYLNFETNLLGQAGTTNNGTAIGAPQYTAGIIGGSAAIFNNDGSGNPPTDWAVSLGNLEWIYAGDWSFSLWISATNTNGGALFGNKDWTSGGNLGWLVDPGSIHFLNYDCAGSARQDIGGVNILDGNWHHVAAVFDRDTNAVAVYVDGSPTAQAALSRTGLESLTDPNIATTLVGGSGNGLYSGTGAIDDLGVWARPLTPGEVLAIYAQGLQHQPLTTAVAGAAIMPSISFSPPGKTVYAGENAVFTVAAAGSPPLAYQWYDNGARVAGATNSSEVLAPVATTNAGSYTVVVSNAFGSITSSPPTVLVVLPVTNITGGLAVYLNFDTNILGQAGTTNNGSPIGAAGVPVYTPGIIGGSAALFNNDGSGTTPSDWAVSLGNIEWIYAGNWSFSLWVNATNSNDGALFGNKDWTSGGDVGWLFDPSRTKFLNYDCVSTPRQDIGGANTLDGNWHHVAAIFDRDTNTVTVYVDGSQTSQAALGVTGAESLTDTSIETTLVGGSGNGLYSGAGAVDDLAVWARPLSPDEILAIYAQGLNHQPLTTAVAGAALTPFITGQPQPAVWAAGFPAGFAVTATGTQPLAYQWYDGSNRLSGQTNAALKLASVGPADTGSYTVIITNRFGSITSNPTMLTVTPGAATISDGLVVYLDFETNILGQAGTTNGGAAIGNVGVARYTNGIIGASAAAFENDGSGSPAPSDWAVSLGNIEWIYATNWSFSIWVQTKDTLGAFLGNKDWTSGGNLGWVISEYYTTFLNYEAVDSPRYDIGPAKSWADGKWHHVAVTFYRDVNTVFVFLDGTLTAQAPVSTTGQESLTDPNIETTLVGGSGNGAYSSSANIDDLGMWVRPLNPAEVTDIYQAGLAGRNLNQAGLIPPTLNAALSGTNLVLTFPNSANNYTLQSTTNLNSASWSTVNPASTTVGSNTVVTVPVPKGNLFFRLKL